MGIKNGAGMPHLFARIENNTHSPETSHCMKGFQQPIACG
jgi:hypothetical protein